MKKTLIILLLASCCGLQAMEEGAGPFKGDDVPELERPITFDDLNEQEQSTYQIFKQLVHSTDTKRAKLMIPGLGRAINLVEDGQTLLHEAVNQNSPEIVERLVKHGANPNIKDSFGETSLLKAVLKKNPAVVKLLLDAGADPSMVAGVYAPSITVFASHTLSDVFGNLEEEHREVMKLLLEKDPNYNNELETKSIDEIVKSIVRPARDDDDSSEEDIEEEFETIES